jgi:hypothetical protein
MKLSPVQRQQPEEAFKQFEENQNQRAFLTQLKRRQASWRTRRNRSKSCVSLSRLAAILLTLRTNPSEVTRIRWLRVLALS